MSVSEELVVLREVVERLQRAGLSYMVTGSLAVSFYGLPRMTRDIDIVLEVGIGGAATVCSLFQQGFYLDPGAVRDAIARRGMFNIIHRAFVIKVDFIVRKDEAYRREEFQRRRTVSVEGLEMAMVTPEELVLSKLVWAKDTHWEMHLGDARNVLRNAQHLDHVYLERWAKHLGVDQLYREVSG